MVNEQLVGLSRAIVTAVRGAQFEPEELKALFLKVVPELLAEIEILANITAAVLPDVEPEAEEDIAPLPESRNARRRRKRRGKR